MRELMLEVGYGSAKASPGHYIYPSRLGRPRPKKRVDSLGAALVLHLDPLESKEHKQRSVKDLGFGSRQPTAWMTLSVPRPKAQGEVK